MTSTPLKTSDISIIIAALNEADNISPLAASCADHDGEIILVDGGSTDDTVALAQNHGFMTLAGVRGRAAQMNHGAAHAAGAILLFMHADTRLPENFAAPLLSNLNRPDTALCAFSLAIDGASPLLRLIGWGATLRSRWLQLPYGDQCLAIRAPLFNRLGGFADMAIMEDYEFVRRAARFGAVVTLPQQARTSARRWHRVGILRTTIINQLVVIGYHMGVSTDKLALLYRRGLIGKK
jgi:rSAM/selenodomain-associated transferase 2